MASPPRDGPRSWVRAHFDGKVVAELHWLGGQYEIGVYRMPTRESLAAACCTEKLSLAQRRADRMVHEVFPHTCDKSECAPWLAYTATAPSAR